MKSTEKNASTLSSAVVDGRSQILRAEGVLAHIQKAFGGEVLGIIAVPELLAIVETARKHQMHVTRRFQASDGAMDWTIEVEVSPSSEHGENACCIHGLHVHGETPSSVQQLSDGSRQLEIDRALAEAFAVLDPAQNIVAFFSHAEDLEQAQHDCGNSVGHSWTELAQLTEYDTLNYRQLVDTATCHFDGSERIWRAQTRPLGFKLDGSDGLELYLAPLMSFVDDENATADGDQSLSHVALDVLPDLHGRVANILTAHQMIAASLAGPLNLNLQERASDISLAGNHLLSLLDDIADAGSADRSDINLSQTTFALADVALQAARILSVRAQSRSINVAVQAADRKAIVRGDAHRTLQIVLNIVSNAIQYSPKGTQVLLQILEGDTQHSIKIADQGRGLSAEEQKKVFCKHQRFSKDNEEGTGIGLYIARELAESMSGTLTVDSTPGIGAEFTLTLPATGENI